MYAPCLGVNVAHHNMISSIMPAHNISKSTNIPFVNIKECVARELHVDMLASLPVMDGNVELIKVLVQCSDVQRALTAVATSATMGAGTSRVITPSLLRHLGKILICLKTKDFCPPEKNISWITAMIQSFL